MSPTNLQSLKSNSVRIAEISLRTERVALRRRRFHHRRCRNVTTRVTNSEELLTWTPVVVRFVTIIGIHCIRRTLI